jgi:hypothetical protein
MREVQILWRVEQERAERREKQGLKQNASAPTAPSERDEDRGDTRKKVANKTGVGIVRAQQLNTVANTIDALKQAGKQDEAAQLTPSQSAAVAADYKPLAAKEAKERQIEAVRRGNVSRHLDAPVVEQVSPLETGKARDIAGQKFGVSGGYVGRAERVKKTDAALFEDAKRGRLAAPPLRCQPIGRSGQDD